MGYLKRDFISIEDFSKEELDFIIEKAKEIKKERPKDLLNGYLSANLFFEPSTRTRLSFESAISLAGGRYIEIADPQITSLQKGESLYDTIKMIEGYAHLIVIRHYQSGIARWASDIAGIPIINAGDGDNRHPTQVLQDLFTIKEQLGSIESLKIGILGDLQHGRVVNSLIDALSIYNVKKLYLISPDSLRLSKNMISKLQYHNVPFEELPTFDDILNELDVIYVTRVQRERFEDLEEYNKVKSSYKISLASIQKYGNGHLKIMHPFPRNDELDVDLDDYKNSLYFQQAHNGIFMRQALLGLVLGEIDDIKVPSKENFKVTSDLHCENVKCVTNNYQDFKVQRTHSENYDKCYYCGRILKNN